MTYNHAVSRPKDSIDDAARTLDQRPVADTRLAIEATLRAASSHAALIGESAVEAPLPAGHGANTRSARRSARVVWAR